MEYLPAYTVLKIVRVNLNNLRLIRLVDVEDYEDSLQPIAEGLLLCRG